MQGNLVHFVVAGCVLLAPLAALAMATVAPQTSTAPPLPPDVCRRIAGEVEANLKTHILGKWFPLAVDKERGGFHQNYAENWARIPRNDRSIVYQSRLTWTAAQAALTYPNEAATYKEYARHGVKYLETGLWDAEKGGFYWSQDEAGKPGFERNGEKHAYGNAFAIYAASTAYHATHDADALDLAKRAYAWLETHAHDTKNGGYYEALTRDGTPILAPPANGPTSDFIGTRYGLKSMNTHIHILEALTALYEVWPDAGVKARLTEVFNIIRDKIAVTPGYQHLYLNPDWTPVPGPDSYGHDVETGYLLVETAIVLKKEDARTWQVARILVDHPLEVGWDKEHGGFYDSGPILGAPTNTEKVWWTEAEGLNALLLMHEKYGKETPRYGQAFLTLWDFIQKHQIDSVNGGWFAYLDHNGKSLGRPKSDRWTESYHQGRALMNVAARLRHLAG